jgi:hypothetical protein
MNPGAWTALSGLESLNHVIPRALPWAGIDRLFEAEELSANGAAYGSPGQRPGSEGHRPGFTVPHSSPALKGRANALSSDAIRGLHPSRWVALSGLASFVDAIPRALPWAALVCPVGAQIRSANGAAYGSPGQRPGSEGHRPGFTVPHSSPALKGRANA